MAVTRTSRVLELREYATTRDVELSPTEVRVLTESAAGIKVLTSGGPGRFHIETSQIVGTVVGPSLRALIRPKLSIRRLLFLMGYAQRLPSMSDEVALASDDDVMEAMQWLFANALERALTGGPVRDYVSWNVDLVRPRGRIDVLATARRRFGSVLPTTCDEDEFTSDIDANRRLLAAANVLLRVKSSSSAASIRLRALAERLEGVTLVRYHRSALRPLTLDRRFDRYGPALPLAELILRGGSVELHHGQTDAVSFLVNMDELFEDFVSVALREALGLDSRVWKRQPPRTFLDEADAVKIEPDILWLHERGTPRLVLDVKYKSRQQASNDDLYQMTAYCNALGLRSGVLIYAKVSETAYVIRNGGPTIHTVEFDPDGSPEDLRRRASEVAVRLEALGAGRGVSLVVPSRV